jgi:hypothetical protein
MKTTLAHLGSSKLLLGLAGLLSFAILAPVAHAEEGDPPSRVARISFLDGTVSFQPGGEGDWGSAARNRPVTVGDKLWTDKASRAELQAGQASIHMGSMTAISFLNLDENIMQVRIAEGAIHFRVRELREGDVYEVDTPNVAFTVKQAGAFRVDVSENGDATAITAIPATGPNSTASTIPNTKSPLRRPSPMISTAGPRTAICTKTIPHPRDTFLQRSRAEATSTITALGTKNPNMATSGIQEL